MVTDTPRRGRDFWSTSRVLVEWKRADQLNLKVAAVRQILAVLAAVCLLSVSARISGADFESPQPNALIATAETSPGLSGVSLTSRISSGLISNGPLHAKHLAELRQLTPHLPLPSKSGFLLAGICKQLSPALAFPQFGRSPPFSYDLNPF